MKNTVYTYYFTIRKPDAAAPERCQARLSQTGAHDLAQRLANRHQATVRVSIFTSEEEHGCVFYPN